MLSLCWRLALQALGGVELLDVLFPLLYVSVGFVEALSAYGVLVKSPCAQAPFAPRAVWSGKCSQCRSMATCQLGWAGFFKRPRKDNFYM